MAQFNNYDPGRYVLVLNGVTIQGFAEGTMIKLGRVTPSFSDKAGGDGYVVRTKSRDRRGECEVNLMVSSPSNDYLSGLCVTDEQVDAGVGAVGPFLLKDLNGTTVGAGSAAWVTQPADAEVAVDAPNRQWKIRIANLKLFTGGLTV